MRFPRVGQEITRTYFWRYELALLSVKMSMLGWILALTDLRSERKATLCLNKWPTPKIHRPETSHHYESIAAMSEKQRYSS